MGNDSLNKLKEENTRLAQLASYDELTGILNRRATEQIINENLDKGGALFVGDLDRFKNINDRFGHLVGDDCLRKAAKILNYLMRQSDIVGRVGGDEFVIFAFGIDSQEGIDMICQKIQKRFKSHNEDRSQIPLSITVAGTLWKKGDTYRKMFDRADQAMIVMKEQKRSGKGGEPIPDNYLKDMKQIRSELVEKITNTGACCHDYETFKNIYRFLERMMRRNNQKACLVLMTLVDAENFSVSPQDKEDEMQKLAHILQSSLRLGDLYTRYSSSQYLILLMDVEEEMAKKVSDRIKQGFLKEASNKNVLVHYCYQLQPARIE